MRGIKGVLNCGMPEDVVQIGKQGLYQPNYYFLQNKGGIS